MWRSSSARSVRWLRSRRRAPAASRPPPAPRPRLSAAAPVAVLLWLAAAGGLGAWYEIVTGYLIPLYSRLGRTSPWSVYRWHAWIPIDVGVSVSLVAALLRRRAAARHLVAALGVAYG